MKRILCLAFLGASPALAAPQSPEERLAQIENYCIKKYSSFEYRNCMAEQVVKIDRELASAVRKRHFDIREIEIEKEGAVVGQLAGKEEAKRYRLAFDKEQATFVSYRKQKCENVYNFEYAGGSNASGFASKCHLRLTVQRVYDLNFGF